MLNKSTVAYFIESRLAVKIWASQFSIFGTSYLAWQLIFEQASAEW